MDQKGASVDYFLLAAEPSGDLHGAELIEELKKTHPSSKIAAVMGPKMREKEGIIPISQMEKLQSMGFVDLLISIPRLIFYFYYLRKEILRLNPKVAIFIDYPGFNLRLERSLRKMGFKGKMIHYASPSVWAHGKSRISLMEKNLDHLLTIYPFETKCYAHTKLPVSYIGNPIYQKVMRAQTKEDRSNNLIALFPGSRKTEIERNLPLMLKVIESLSPTFSFAISCSHLEHEKRIHELSKSSKQKIEIIPPQRSYELMSSAHLAIATSGTVILELAMHSVPTVVTFAIKPVDLFIARKLLKIDLPFYSIVNIIFEGEVFPELFGPNLTTAKLSYYVDRFLYSDEARKRCIEDLEKVKKLLASENPAKKAAEIIYTAAIKK